jgi:hypothetical protein
VQRLWDAGDVKGEAGSVPWVRSAVRGYSGAGHLTLTREERQAALTIMDWAFYDPRAEVAAPDRVKEYRAFCATPWGGDPALWRRAFGLALDIWKADHDRMREAF